MIQDYPGYTGVINGKDHGDYDMECLSIKDP